MKTHVPFFLTAILLAGCQYGEDPIVVDNGSTVELNENSSARMSANFPEQIFLPNGFQPEGIENGKGSDFYVGSLAEGAIYKGDFRTGKGFILVPPQPGKSAVGLAYDARTDYLYVADAPGKAYVYNASTGEEVAEIQLSPPVNTFINDCYVTREAVYFTNSFQRVFYSIPLDKGGRLPDPVTFETIDLSDNFSLIPGAFNGNGIVASQDGKQLIIGNLASGELYLVDPLTGDAQLIDLGGGAVPFVDGLVLEGKTLYCVQNFMNQISVVQLKPDLTAGKIVGVIVHDEFKIPTTATLFGNRLYAVNARFDVTPSPSTKYDVIGIDKK
jgi:hypothetical protein